MQDYILEMKDISKIYGNGIAANKDVDFNLKKGEIHGMLNIVRGFRYYWRFSF